jgi:hypothetical protein
VTAQTATINNAIANVTGLPAVVEAHLASIGNHE